MVQRTGLALILLLTLAVSFLFAQETTEFSPPRLLSEPVLDIPESFQNPPDDVMILVEVKADSTATLIKILDGKEELKSNIEELLPYLMFVPAIKKGEPFTSTLSFKLTVRKPGAMQQPDKQAAADSLNKVDKELLISDIKDKLANEDIQHLSSNDTMYRTNFYMMGLNTNSDLFIKDGFIEPARIYYNALQYQMLSSFRDIDIDKTGVGTTTFSAVKADWQVPRIKKQNPDTTVVSSIKSKTSADSTDTVRQYPWAAMCTDVYAGLGDYEFNFAKGQVLKNHLFGVKDFYSEFGFLVQNGWWQETISDQTSMRIFLKMPLHFYGTNLLFNYESYDQNIPSTTLLPGLQNGSLFRIGQKLQSLYIKWKLPWFTVGWQSSKERFSAPGILNKQEFNTGNILLEDKLRFLDTDINWTYQYNGKTDMPDVQTLYQYNKPNKYQGLIKINHKHNALRSDNQLLLSENGLEKADVVLGNFFNARFGAGLSFKYYQGKHYTGAMQDFYADTTDVYFPSAYIKQSVMADIMWVASEDVNTKLSAGVNKFDTAQGISVPNGYALFSENCPSAKFELSASKEFGSLKASLDQTIQWTQYKKGLYEQPELTGQARFKLVRDMKYNNALSAGFNLTGHTDYIQADSLNTPIWGSLVADAWLGVKITDLFEFQLMMKNLGNNPIFGLSPHPRTIIGTIHWFYLN